jgi:hypothetical protein
MNLDTYKLYGVCRDTNNIQESTLEKLEKHLIPSDGRQYWMDNFWIVEMTFFPMDYNRIQLG